MKTSYLLIFTMFLPLLFNSCKKDENEAPILPNEEELITTLVYTLTPVDGGSSVVFSFQDSDGDGGNTPIIIEGILAANTEYTGALSLLNESVDPISDISAEVLEEGTMHQVFYQTESNLDMLIAYSDTDTNGNPIGLLTTISTANISTGTLKITLRHEPTKTANGVSAGNIENAGGETDIEVTFIVEID